METKPCYFEPDRAAWLYSFCWDMNQANEMVQVGPFVIEPKRILCHPFPLQAAEIVLQEVDKAKERAQAEQTPKTSTCVNLKW